MLVQSSHPDIWSAAISIAANRASKIDLLRSHKQPELDQIAARYLTNLERDVSAFIAEHKCPTDMANALRDAATPENQEN